MNSCSPSSRVGDCDRFDRDDCRRAGDEEGNGRRGRPGRYRRLAGLHRAGRDRQELRLGHRLREDDRLQGQHQDGRHVGRNGRPDERRRLRSRHRLGRCIAPAHLRQARTADQRRPRFRPGRPSTSVCRMRPGTRSTASITAFPTSGAPTCSPTTPMCSRKRRRAGRSCSRSRTCRTASPTRAASRRSTARSTSPTPRST